MKTAEHMLPPCFSVNKHSKLKYILAILFIASLIFAGCPSPGGGGANGGMGAFTVTIGNGSKSALSWDPSVDSEKLTHYITLSGGAGGPHNAEIPPGGGTASFTVAEGWWDVKAEGKLNGVLKSYGTERVNVKAGQKNTVTVTMGKPSVDPSKPPVGPTDPTVPIGPPTSWTAVASSTFTSSINAIAYGNDRFIAGGDGGQLGYSLDGVNWNTLSSSSLVSDIRTIAYGGSRFIAGGDYAQLAYSSDYGASWTMITGTSNPFNATGTIYTIAYGNGYFQAGGSDGQDAISTNNGVSWIGSTSGSNDIKAYVYAGVNAGVTTFKSVTLYQSKQINAIAYDGVNIFVIGGDNGTMAYSINGTNYTPITGVFASTENIYAIAYGEGWFVAGGDNGQMKYSKDGITWSPVTNSTFVTSDVIRAITYGNGRFVAVGTGGKIAYSN